VFEPTERYKWPEVEEEFANRYAVEVIKRMRRRWHYRLGLWMLKDLADWHYMMGIREWRDKRYGEAAEHWHKSVRLYPDASEVVYWYYRAKDMAASGATTGEG
jgi:hypothetical protein